MQKNVEIELKLLLGKRELKKLLASELLKGVLRAGSEKKRNLVSSYYDTADLAFKKNGVAYRVRDKGDGSFEATIKTDRKSSGGLSERVEINIPLAENTAVLEGFGERGLGFELTELAPEGVAKLFTVDVVRTTYLLDLEGAVVELAIDNGKIIAGKRKDDIDEIEIEEDKIIGENQYKKIADVAVWRLQTLHECLLTKHHETFWIEVDTRIGDQGQEQFMFNKIEHTRNPIVSQFDILLEQSMITVDLLLGRPKVDLETGKPKKGGDAVSFKIKKSAAGLLFPDSVIYTF